MPLAPIGLEPLPGEAIPIGGPEINWHEIAMNTYINKASTRSEKPKAPGYYLELRERLSKYQHLAAIRPSDPTQLEICKAMNKLLKQAGRGDLRIETHSTKTAFMTELSNLVWSLVKEADGPHPEE